MPRSIKNPYGITLRYLIQNTYVHMRNRFDYKERDVLSRVTVQKVTVYNGLNPGEARTKYIIRSYSYPQYAPYYTKLDNRGRPRRKQRTYKHQYDVTIQMDSLSLDETGIKLRTGSDCKWNFNENGQGKWIGVGRNRRYQEGTNVLKGRNGDFFFRLEWLYAQKGILYGRNWTNGAPNRTNPKQALFLDKHMLSVVEYLVNRGIIQ